MNYETAAKIAAQHSPNLNLAPHVEGQNHIEVRKTEKGAPFNIMLPTSVRAEGVTEQDQAAAEAKLLTDALDEAEKHLVG